MSTYVCDACRHPVEIGDGYIHSSVVGLWQIHHKRCWPDWRREFCFEIPRSWSDILEAHRDLSIRRRPELGAEQ